MKKSDAYLEREDWLYAQRQFNQKAKEVTEQLCGDEPVLTEAFCTRSNNIERMLAATNLDPEVRGMLRTASVRMAAECMQLLRQKYERILADLLPGPDLRVKTVDEETGPCKEQP